jgi:hypothetical protein
MRPELKLAEFSILALHEFRRAPLHGACRTSCCCTLRAITVLRPDSEILGTQSSLEIPTHNGPIFGSIHQAEQNKGVRNRFKVLGS